MQGSITFEELKAMEGAFLADRSNRIAMNAVVNNGLLISAKNAEAYRTTTHNYSVNITICTGSSGSGGCDKAHAVGVRATTYIHIDMVALADYQTMWEVKGIAA